MGSSAAVAHAVFKALGKFFDTALTEKELMDLVQQTETFAHGSPSGVDTVAIIKGGVLKFQRQAGQLTYDSLTAPSFTDRQFLLIQSGKPEETTREMVGLVADNVKSKPLLNQVLSQIGELTQKMVDHLPSALIEPHLLTENQRLLEKLGVVGEKAVSIVGEIEKSGGSAKITGAGGVKAGSGMILAYHDDISVLEQFAADQGYESYKVQLGRN
jgi:mevalonate kinase